jgi:eukaryotic-like serine/threonine-protein kinase
MSEPPPPPRVPPEPDDETIVVPPAERTVVGDEWEQPEREVFVERAETVPPRRRPPLLWPGLLALLLLVLGALGALYFVSRDDDEAAPPTTATVARAEVPVLVGLREDRAEERAREAGFEPRIQRDAHAEPRGVVFEQNPEAGRELATGKTVLLKVSSGPAQVKVPDVVGTTTGEATATLRELGLEVNLVPVPSDRPPGSVVAQNPKPGTEAPKGSTVRLNVAQADGGTTTGETTTTPTTTTTTTTPQSQPATVPDVVGQELADAARAFADQGLKVSLRYVPSNEATGRVVAQAQPAGTQRRRGDTVQLNVSIGAQPAAAAAVPDVVGQRNAQARQALESAGFEVLALKLDGAVRNESIVASQSPAAGVSIPRGSLVILYAG